MRRLCHIIISANTVLDTKTVDYMKSQIHTTWTFHRVHFFLYADSASNLKRVDLSHNYLESLSPDIKSDIFTDSLVSIKLNDNYWICDCHLRYESSMYNIHTRNDNLKLSSHVHWEDNCSIRIKEHIGLNSQNLDKALQRGTLFCIIIKLWGVTGFLSAELYRRLGNLGNCLLNVHERTTCDSHF